MPAEFGREDRLGPPRSLIYWRTEPVLPTFNRLLSQ